ncbi:hypothetical protein SAY86_010075 [Trapa natans]|uniref:Uncharacterized protein n=1 Tax=Trapa natans TaxID=22666 RepID=A0AAN7KY10_TRANT|nr:hypothetical protein SAY86_010075 [Trapa natans]
MDHGRRLNEICNPLSLFLQVLSWTMSMESKMHFAGLEAANLVVGHFGYREFTINFLDDEDEHPIQVLPSFSRSLKELRSRLLFQIYLCNESIAGLLCNNVFLHTKHIMSRIRAPSD